MAFALVLALIGMIPSWTLTQRNRRGKGKDKLRTPPKQRIKKAAKRPTPEVDEALGKHRCSRTTHFPCTYLPLPETAFHALSPKRPEKNHFVFF
jgi:hypothetical protein